MVGRTHAEEERWMQRWQPKKNFEQKDPRRHGQTLVIGFKRDSSLLCGGACAGGFLVGRIRATDKQSSHLVAVVFLLPQPFLGITLSIPLLFLF